MRVLLQRHDFVYPDASESADTTEIVTLEIDQHDVFRPLLLIGSEFTDESLILERRFSSRPGSCDRPGVGPTIIEADKALGR
jgi:hypothetical protein